MPRETAARFQGSRHKEACGRSDPHPLIRRQNLPLKKEVDGSATHVAVMLHARACYVSKAAIFITPVLSRAGLKIEVPLEFQGLGSLGAVTCGDGFSLASLTAKKS